MDVTDGAAAASPHIVLMDGSLKRRRPPSGEIRWVPFSGGYDATFSRGGFDAKHMCTVCSKVLRQPLQTKCGHRFCASCISPLMVGGDVNCPDTNCSSTLSQRDLFPDTFAEREVLALDVLCSAITEGCPWTGKLKELEDHLEECNYVRVQCGENGCPDHVQRRYLNTHRQETCRYRFVDCAHCGTPVVLHLMQEHQFRCQEWPTDCPQNCGATAIPKSLVEEHLEKQCPLTTSTCKFEFVNCSFQGNRRDMEEHLQMHSNQHLVQLANLCHLQQRQLSDRAKEVTALQTQLSDVVEHLRSSRATSLGSEPSMASPSKSAGVLPSFFTRGRGSSPAPISEQSDALRAALDRISKLEQRLLSVESAPSHNGILVWKIDSFSKQRHDARNGTTRHMTSPPFYTSPHGYKLCARAYLNGDGIGESAFVSLYIAVMRGEYDALLRWPFSARITLTLIDQGASQRHHHEKFFPDNRASSFGRPMSETNVASGCPKFFLLSALDHFGYVRDDTIVFRVFVDTTSIQGVDTPAFA